MNINQPDDANTDLDEDGLSNLNEFNLATDPTISNKIPTLTNKILLLYEQGRTQFKPCILDSDTPSDALWITLVTIPPDITMAGFGDLKKGNGYIFQPGDCVSLQDIEQGNIIMTHTPSVTEAWSFTSGTSIDMIVTINDSQHPPIKETLKIEVFKPSATDGSDSQVWMDASVDQNKFSDYHEWFNNHVENDQNTLLPQMTFFGRSGNQTGDYLNSYGCDGLTGKDIIMTQEDLPEGKQAIKFQGDTVLRYYTGNQFEKIQPFNMNGDLSLFVVIKACGEKNQIIATYTKSEFSVTGDNHPTYARRLKFAITEDQAIYSGMPIDKLWGIAGCFQNAGTQRLEWNGHYNGSQYPVQEVTQLSISHALGGKIIGNSTSANYHVTDTLNGALGEILIFNKYINYEKKWQIYTCLLSKWFGYVVLDASNMTTNTLHMATSAAEMDVSEEYMSVSNNIPFIKNLTRHDTLLLMFASRSANLKEQYENFKSQYGQDHQYILIGGPAQDTLVGGGEDDILIAGLGEDRLIGLGGSDHFVVLDETIVVDYSPWEKDILDLSYLLIPNNNNTFIENYISLESDMSGTMIHIDVNGDGSGFTDATVFLTNITLHNSDLLKLWAGGEIITGGPRPKNELGLVLQTILFDDWTEIEGKPVEIKLTGTIPNGMLIPFELTGKAELGKDYHLGIDYYNSKTGSYEIYETEGSTLPISIEPGIQKVLQPQIYIFPHKDTVSENPETVNIILRNVPDYFDVHMDKKQVELLLKDGTDQVRIVSTVNRVNASEKKNGEIKITRQGCLDRDLKVNLAIQGTAKMGTDFYYIPSEMTIPSGEEEVRLFIRPISPEMIERDKIVEVFLMISDQYDVKGTGSARVTITNKSIINGDINGNGSADLADLILALQICAGKRVGDIYYNKNIGLDNILFLMKKIF